MCWWVSGKWSVGRWSVVLTKPKLTYVTLMHQIDEEKEAAYEESKIQSSVFRAMIPRLTPRNERESIPNL